MYTLVCVSCNFISTTPCYHTPFGSINCLLCSIVYYTCAVCLLEPNENPDEGYNSQS